MTAPQPSGRRGHLLANPFVLGAGALIIAIAAGVGVAIGLGRDGGESLVAPTETAAPGAPTPSPTAEPRGVRARAAVTLTLHSGPGASFVSLGVVPKGTELEVAAKSDGEQWLEVIYPPRSHLRGWVQLEDVELWGDMADLPVGGAELFVLPEVPTAVPTEAVEVVDTTPELLLPDLVASDAFVAGGFLVVLITNGGSVNLVREVIDVGVYDASLSRILGATRAGPLSLYPGQSVNISTGFRVDDSESRRLVIVINAGQTIDEADYTNNNLVFVLTESFPTETPTAEAPKVTPTHGPILPVPTRSPTRTPRAIPTPKDTATPTPPVVAETPTPTSPSATETPLVPPVQGTPAGSAP